MKKIMMLLAIVCLVGCNGEKKEAAYECESCLEQADQALEDGYYDIQQARAARDWDSTHRYLQEAMSYFNKAEQDAKRAESIASYYDSTVEDEANKAARAAADAYSYARRAVSSTNNSDVDVLTKKSKSSAYDAQKAIEQAKRYLWY